MTAVSYSHCPLHLSAGQCPSCYWRESSECRFGLTCEACGHIHVPDDGVRRDYVYVGGQGYQRRTACEDIDKCLERIREG